MEPRVKLVSNTNDPLETLYIIWWASKSENPLLTVDEVKAGKRDPDDPMGDDGLLELFRKVVAQQIPVSESIYFNFMMEGVSVSWREQAVRHRVGHKHDDRIGVDLIPDLTSSSWWSQSMRIQDMGQFATNGMYRIANTIRQMGWTNPELYKLYNDTMKDIESAYNRLVEAGVPMEDARDLIPLGAQHRISWTMNINSMLHIVGKRSCWILQLGLWGPVIRGMVKECSSKVHPIFAEMATPPCLSGDKFKGCKYEHENERRVSGEDALPVCPMYANLVAGLDPAEVESGFNPMGKQRIGEYQDYWRRDPWTGKRLAAK
jgi:hypothetical protein